MNERRTMWKSRILLRLVAGLALSRSLFVFAEQQAPRPPHRVKVEKNVRIPMRDGVTLAADFYRPDADGRFPALVQLSYYITGPAQAEFFAPHGYVCVLANSRGRGGSEGDWDPYVNEPRDGFDLQQWVGQQPWCSGQVGMFGQSYNAFTQTMSAPLASPYLKCIVPVEGQQSFFGHQYNDGVMQLNVVFTHGLFATGATGLQGHIPIRDPHFLQLPLMSAADKVAHPQAQRIKLWMQHARYDEHWKAFSVKDKYDRIQAPAHFASGWYDNLVHENFRNFEGFRRQGGNESVRQGTKLRVGPGVHGANPLPYIEQLRWYDYWLKGLPTGIDKEAPLRIFVMGAGKWRDEYEWPLARTRFTKFYLHSGGHANSVRGDGRLTTAVPGGDSQADRFVYDPANPVVTLGGQISTNPEVWGPQDRQSVQTREDVLVYTTDPLAEDTEVTGPVEVRLYAASTAVDTDFTATLTDVHPDGRAIQICEGIRGVTFRESLEQPTLIVPGQVYEYSISLWDTSQVFEKGHRIRLEISSSNFPRYARNQNTGLPLGTSAEIKTATQTIFHDAERPSHLILPLIPAEQPGPVQPRADGSLRLTGDTASLSGPSLKLAADAGILGWWTHEEDRAAWTVGVKQAGRYRVVLNFACADDAAGNEFELTIGSSRLTGKVPGTGTWHDQREAEFGEVELRAGVQAVVVRPLGAVRGALFDLRAVQLLSAAI
jgi:putative CocE/NonD family hydrolase